MKTVTGRPEAVVEAARMEHIMNVDTNALLRTLKDLESKLSESYRQDAVPTWASSILPRLQLIEDKVSQTYSPEANVYKPEANLSVEHLAQEERIFERLRSEIEAQAGSTRLSLESKVATLTMELERVHKLLQIRPTTSELQRVQFSVHENDMKIQRVVVDIQANVQSMVQEKMASEMVNILDNMKSGSSKQEDGMKSLMKKVDGFSQDLGNLKLGIENSLGIVNTLVSKLKESTSQNSEDLLQLRAEVESSNRRMQGSLTEVQRFQKDTHDSLSEHRLFTREKLDSINMKLDRNEEGLNEVVRAAEEFETSIRGSLSEISASLDDFRVMYSLDVDDLKNSSQTMLESLNNTKSQQEELSRFMRALKDVDVLNRVPEQKERLADLEKRAASVEKDVKSLNNLNKVSGKNMADVNDSIQTLTAKVDFEVARVTHVSKGVDEVNDVIKRLQFVQRETKTQVDELCVLRDEVAVVRELTRSNEQIVKSQQNSLESLLENVEDMEKKHSDVEKQIKFNDDKTLKKMEELRKEVVIHVADKNEQMMQTITVLKDNLEIAASKDAASVGGNSRQGNSLGGGSLADLSHTLVPKDEQRALLVDRAQFVVDLCLNFEEIAVRKTSIPDLPESVAEHLAALSQAFAIFAASSSDGEAIVDMLRGRTEDIVYEDSIATRRLTMVNDLMGLISRRLNEHTSDLGLIRGEAREKFLSKLKKALETALSKHDQVQILMHSRLGRTKIPTCIACDRPLVGKVRQDSVLLNDSLSLSEGKGRHRSVVAEYAESPNSLASNPLRMKGPGAIKLSAQRNIVSRESVEDPYVLRGGFKVPSKLENHSKNRLGSFLEGSTMSSVGDTHMTRSAGTMNI